MVTFDVNRNTTDDRNIRFGRIGEFHIFELDLHIFLFTASFGGVSFGLFMFIKSNS